MVLSALKHKGIFTYYIYILTIIGLLFLVDTCNDITVATVASEATAYIDSALFNLYS
jgi:hypothetical protein